MRTVVFALLSFTFFAATAQTTGGNHLLLPENLAFFKASRDGGAVVLEWQTVNEQNSRGFAVQRKTAGGWEQVAFLQSNSGGNSSARVSYAYMEINNFRGVTQYRVAEVTNEGKHRWSEIKAVKAEAQTGRLLLFPNPTTDGRINLLFEKSAARSIRINNVTGQVVKEYKSADASLLIENLQPGFYTILITDCATGEAYAEKVLVQ